MSLYTRPRKPSWSYTLLDDSDTPIRSMREVVGGSAEIVALSRLGGSATLDLKDLGQDIDWMRHRVQVTYDPGVTGFPAWPVGVFMLSSPNERHDASGRSWSVAMLPKMQVIDEDQLSSTLSYPAGTNYVAAAVALIQSTGETRIAVTESDLVSAGALTFEAGTPKLTVVNELLTAAGYWSLWVDGSGQFRVEPYVNPADRAVSIDFRDSKGALHSVNWEREQDHSAVPNRFVVVGEGDGDTPPLVGVAENTDRNSPYSYPSRGRWITRTEEGVEAATQSVINQLAKRRLNDAMAPVGHLSVEHLMLPLNPNDVVSFSHGTYSGLATVQRMSCDFTTGTTIKAEWREIQ